MSPPNRPPRPRRRQRRRGRGVQATTMTVAHATGCPHCSAYIEHLSEVDSTSGSFAAAIEARDSFYTDRANRGMLPGCDVALLEDDVRGFRRTMEEVIVTRDEYLHELRDQDSEIATLKEELAVAQAQLASVSIPPVAQGGRGSGGSSKPTTRGKASSFVPPTSKPPLLNKGKTFELPSAGLATLASHAKPTTTLALSTKTPATSSLPNIASKPAAVPTSEKGKGPAAPIPEKGKGKDIWRDSSPPEKLSKRARKRLNQEVNPNLFGYVTDESNSEEECDMRRAIRVSRDEQTQAVYEDNGASSSVPNPPRKTVARRDKGKAVETAPQAAEVHEDAPEVLPDDSTFYGRGEQPPGWLEGERGNLLFRFEGEKDGTLVVLVGGPPSLDGARQDAIPLFNNYAEWRSYFARAHNPRMRDIETIYKIKRYVAHAQQASPRTWIQAVVLEEWRTPTWFAKWREDHPPAAPSGADARSNVPARGIHPKPEWKDWIEFYSKEFHGVPLEGGTVSLRDMRGHILTSRLNPSFEKGSNERRRTIFKYRLCLLAPVPGLYREYLAMFAWPIAPTFEPVDDIQPYGRHWLSCCLDTCHGFLTDDECAALSERLVIAASPDTSTTLSLEGRAELEAIAREQGTEPPDAAPASRLFSSLDDEQMSLLADPPTVHNLVTASATSGFVAGGFAATNPLVDVDHEMGRSLSTTEREMYPST
ncbi:hypothetical protein BV22DRAFT_1134365 [Leucogyrophana mollusca]|uniref:Uncharacterized protein n=1 Tax=Leucogyrophana mollusca TaxID=85980 RepID=A0ACB8B1M8_9AGAM|nr:hypothetical protein BV22DRAFT_1134365 [Leucogyrophana mollusca]